MDFKYVTLQEKISDEYHPITWRSIDEVPSLALSQVYDRQESINQRTDVLTPLKLGKEWLFELTKQHQPRAARLLLEGSELLVTCGFDGDWYTTLELAMECHGKCIDIERRSYGNNRSDPDWEKNCFKNERYFSLPEPIRLAYYHRFDGLSIPKGPVSGIYTRLLPFPIGRPWESFDGYLKSIRIPFTKQEAWYSWLEERIPGVRPDKKGKPFTKFMMFLDTRPTLIEKPGTVLFVKNHIQDGVIYAIHDGDVANMQILAEPAEAIDRYCEQVLLKNDCDFDFRPYCVPLQQE